MLLMKPTDYCIITTAVDDKKISTIIIGTLLKKQLAACIQTFPINSHYHWQGEMANSQEILLQIKTKKSLFPRVKSEIENLHSYEVPEIMMIEIQEGNSAYLSWIDEETIKGGI